MTITEDNAEFFGFTRRVLIDARDKRNPAMLRRAGLRIDSERFTRLPGDWQEDLRALYREAMSACGALAP